MPPLAQISKGANVNDVNEIKQGLKVRVISDDGTKGMVIAEKHLRPVGDVNRHGW